jgi:DNA-binding response OmpR family regulator
MTNLQIIEELRDRVEELETLLGLKTKLPDAYGLSPTEEKFVGILLKRKVVNREMFLTAIYGGLTDRTTHLVGMNIWNIRRKLAPWGITIKNQWGRGYYLDDEARAALSEVAA